MIDDNLLQSVQKEIEIRLAKVAGDEAAHQARLILCHALNITLSELIYSQKRMICESELRYIENMVTRRMGAEPLQYILGEWDFYGLTFNVDSRALIPRQDTEILVETALNEIKTNKARTALDLCCGSGCIGVCLSVIGGLNVTFSDISPDCIALALSNIKRHGITEYTVLVGDMFSSISGKYDIITVNPPYLSESDIAKMPAELGFEPRNALYGGKDGLDFYRQIAKHGSKHLASGGMLFIEIGAEQGYAVSGMFKHSQIIKDLSGLDRVVVVRNLE